MKNLNAIKNLSQLLLFLEKEKTPLFVSLCSRCGNENFLLDNIIQKTQAKYAKKIGYKKLSDSASEIIKQELKISKNPVLLLIRQGKIDAVFGGLIAQHQLEKALNSYSS